MGARAKMKKITKITHILLSAICLLVIAFGAQAFAATQQESGSVCVQKIHW
jgi:hypothetical protein